MNDKPVASFSKLIQDEFNKWEFSVNIYETTETFKYLLKLRYKELRITDTLTIPNFSIYPKPDIKNDKKNSCIISFADKKGDFKAYKMVAIKNERLKIIGLKSYFVCVYKTKMS